MSFEANTSPFKIRSSSSRSKHNNLINLDLLLEPSSPINVSPSISPPLSPRVFSCNYCRRKFYSSQALGGHQNAHKLERTLAKKSRELSSFGPNSGTNNRAGPASGLEQGGGLGRIDLNYGYMNLVDSEYNSAELSQIDLSLRL